MGAPVFVTYTVAWKNFDGTPRPDYYTNEQEVNTALIISKEATKARFAKLDYDTPSRKVSDGLFSSHYEYKIAYYNVWKLTCLTMLNESKIYVVVSGPTKEELTVESWQ